MTVPGASRAFSHRQSEILALLEEAGRVSVEDLATRFAVTPQTIRRDLTELSHVRALTRVHGGAMVASGVTNLAYDSRRLVAPEVKRLIGQAAARLIPDHSSVFIRLAEAALARLAPYLPPATQRPAGWTGRESLPGGGFPPTSFEAELAKARHRHPTLPDATLRRLLHAYGTVMDEVLAEPGADRIIGADLTEGEVRYLARREWALTAEDIAWRRSKLGLRLSRAELARIDDVLAATPVAA